MLWYESSLVLAFAVAVAIVVTLDRGTFFGKGGTLAWIRAQRGQSAPVWMIGIIITAVLAVVGSLAIQPLRAAAAVRGCETNLRTIQAALTTYEANVGDFPTQAATAITVYTGGTSPTAGTFSDPSNIATDYLGEAPHDPANSTGSYTLQTTTGTSYVITCPGGHPLWTLKSLSGGGSATAGKITLSNSGLAAI